MKKNYLFICFIFSTSVMLFFNCSGSNHITTFYKKNSLVLNAALGGYDPDTSITIHIAVTIYNPTNDTIIFTSMSCSYEDLFTTNASALEVSGRVPCFSNNLEFITLLPGKRTDRYITLRPEKWELIKLIKRLRIGMYLIKPKANQDYGDLIDLYHNRKQSEIIWSSDLDLERLLRKIY